MAYFFWDRRSIPNSYCETLRCLQRDIQTNERWRHVASPSALQEFSAVLHVPPLPFNSWKWDVLDHPPHSPDLAPSDFHMFLHMNTHLIRKGLMRWVKELAAHFSTRRYQIWFPDLNKSFDSDGSYVKITIYV